ncbi:fasciclin domain-containing protein [Ulvibacterium sp.]|uniref:fasciclin domain-containing protein n=1 Tax=Ulvibacterium sp. TaxID=2665914 RepID=UPI0026371D3D|nr:fasciclin domain-containing protein [Ulvibacterium sp.]
MKRTHTISNLRRFILPLFLSFLVFACSKNDDATDTDGNTDAMNDGENQEETLPNIVELAQSVDVLEYLVDALVQADAGLVEALSEAGENTVFAPTNDAFKALLAQLDGLENVEDFDETAEKELLAEILKYHVIGGTSAFSDELSDGTVLETLQTEELGIKVDATVFVQDKTEEEAEVVAADNEASNGVVHIVDKVLLPQAVLDILFPKPTIVELVSTTDELSLLRDAVVKANLVDALNAEGPFTVFAPSNAAIQELFDLLGDDYASFDDFDNIIELQILEQILLYHVVMGNVGSTDLAPGTVPTLLTDNSIEVIASGETFVIGDASETDANILDADKEASNGTVHIIDKILIPQEVYDLLGLSGDSSAKTIAELVEETEGFSFLKEALELTGLLDTLGEEGPFTVFAPSDEALFGLLALLGEGLGSIEDFDSEFEINLLRDVLLYHVLPGIVTSADLGVSTADTFSDGNSLNIVSTEEGFGLVDATGFPANFIVTDIPAENGVIHTIDRVLIPHSVIEDIATEAASVVMEFVDSLDEEELDYAHCLLVRFNQLFCDILQEEFTFFLPTNQAFLELFGSLDGYDSLADFNTAEDLEILATILSYHFIPNATLTSGDLSDGQSAATLQGEEVMVKIDGGVYILDKSGSPAKVTSPDAEVLNGVIHIIDKVLLPQEILTALSS